MDEEFLYKIYCDYYDIGKPQNFKLNTDVEYIQLLASYKEIKDKTLKKTIKNFKDLFSKKLRDSILNSKNKDCCGMFDEPFGSSKKMNINQLINKI